MLLPKSVKIVEVSPRDGLQNETRIVPTDIKIDFINRLSETGLTVIEATSFVSPKWVPQMADHNEVFKEIIKKSHVSYPVFVPNMNGLKKALAVEVKEIAVFSTPSEQFCRHNINCSVEENLLHLKEMTTLAKQHAVRVRGYISCVLGCPYEGEINPVSVADLAEKLIDLGCYEISLGDTIGVGTVTKTKKLLDTVIKKVSPAKLAVHFHDTYGQALVNLYVALEYGIAVIDSSVAGLGGCPYAPGATGNVASEKVIYMLEGLGIQTGINLTKLKAAGQFIKSYIQQP